jgi:hypothetical protein
MATAAQSEVRVKKPAGAEEAARTTERTNGQQEQARESYDLRVRQGLARLETTELSVEDVAYMLEQRARAALNEAIMRRMSAEIGEPEGWWNVFAVGPLQPLGIPGPLLPHQVIKVGEPAFIGTLVFLNPFLIVPPGTTAGDVLSNFALDCQVQYQTGNLTSWALGPANMNATHTLTFSPGQYLYLDVLSFVADQPGMYQMNITSRILGAAPPHINAPQFGAFARAVVDIDPELFLDGTLGGAPGLQFDEPIRFQVYP